MTLFPVTGRWSRGIEHAAAGCGVIAVAVAFALGGCGDSAVTDAEDAGVDTGPVETFDVAIGAWAPDPESITPMATGATIQIVVGFQGLIFIDLALLAPSDLPPSMTVEGALHFPQNPDLDFTFVQNRLRFDPRSEGTWTWLRVPFGQDVVILDGQDVELDVAVTAAGWRGAGSAAFRIVDEGGCFEGPSGELECF